MDSKDIRSFISSLSTSNEKSNEYILKKVAKIYYDDQQEAYQDQFIIGQINSKDIEKLLTLMENKDKRIRKLTLLVLSFLLRNGKSKIYFLEKCGLGLKLGKIFLSRLKYLTLNIKDLATSIKILTSAIKESKSKIDNTALFWYIPLVDREKKKILTENTRFCYFNTKHIDINDLEEIEPDNIPDPIYNLCGIDLTIFDLQDGSMMANTIDLSRIINNSVMTQDSNIINSRLEQLSTVNSPKSSKSVKKPGTRRKSKVDKSSDNKSQRSVSNTSQYSALNRSHITPFQAKNKVKNKKLKPGTPTKTNTKKSKLKRE